MSESMREFRDRRDAAWKQAELQLARSRHPGNRGASGFESPGAANLQALAAAERRAWAKLYESVRL